MGEICLGHDDTFRGSPDAGAHVVPGIARAAAATDEAKKKGTAATAWAVAKALEMQFEADFSTHLARKMRTRQWRYGALGAGVAGVLGIAASPVLLPGVAVAAVAGGAGGYQWAKRRGQQLIQKHGQAGQGGSGIPDSQRPTLRRLQYLVKWGHWQLLEYEDAPQDLRMAVVDEVVRPFSPWVQRIYCMGRGKKFHGETPERREVLDHLAPLASFLQREATCEVLSQEAEAIGLAALAGSIDAARVDRCMIIFPTILETIAVGADHKRLQRIAASIRTVSEREDVVKGVTNWHPQKGSASPSAVETASSWATAPRHGPLEVPPEGAENEAADSDVERADNEDVPVYYSCSESDFEDGPQPCPAGRAFSGTSQFRQRAVDLPNSCAPHSWRLADCARFSLRAASYLQDRKKEPAGKPMLECISVDMLRIGPDGPIGRATSHPDLCPAAQKSEGDKLFTFIQTWIFPPYQAVVVCALDPEAPWLTDGDNPHARVWQRFLAMSQEERRTVFKIILSVDNGPWLVRKAVPQKPLIIGRQVKVDSYHEPGDYLKVVVDVSSGKAEQAATGIVMRALKRLDIAMGVLIESRTEDELPEAFLCNIAIKNVDTSRLSTPAVATDA